MSRHYYSDHAPIVATLVAPDPPLRPAVAFPSEAELAEDPMLGYTDDFEGQLHPSIRPLTQLPFCAANSVKVTKSEAIDLTDCASSEEARSLKRRVKREGGPAAKHCKRQRGHSMAVPAKPEPEARVKAECTLALERESRGSSHADPIELS